MAKFTQSISLLQSLLILLCLLAVTRDLADAASVKNTTPWVLRFTRNPGARTAPHLCRFWNWPVMPWDRVVKCYQDYVSSGKSATGVVKGYTFAERNYYVNKVLRFGGHWTYIVATQKVKCVNSGEIPYCEG